MNSYDYSSLLIVSAIRSFSPTGEIFWMSQVGSMLGLFVCSTVISSWTQNSAWVSTSISRRKSRRYNILFLMKTDVGFNPFDFLLKTELMTFVAFCLERVEAIAIELVASKSKSSPSNVSFSVQQTHCSLIWLSYATRISLSVH